MQIMIDGYYNKINIFCVIIIIIIIILYNLYITGPFQYPFYQFSRTGLQV